VSVRGRSIDILCGDNALEVYRQMLLAGLGVECRSRVPAARRKYKEVVKTEDGQHTLLTITHSPGAHTSALRLSPVPAHHALPRHARCHAASPASAS
jgi:hypothetical protein